MPQAWILEAADVFEHPMLALVVGPSAPLACALVDGGLRDFRAAVVLMFARGVAHAGYHDAGNATATHNDADAAGLIHANKKCSLGIGLAMRYSHPGPEIQLERQSTTWLAVDILP